MKSLDLRMDPQRAKNIGRLLFRKYDTSRKGAIEPVQCYKLFNDYCYQILNYKTVPAV